MPGCLSVVHVHATQQEDGTNELIDIDSEKIQLKHVPQPPKGKKINGIEVVINVREEI